jgi:hypothetical protein
MTRPRPWRGILLAAVVAIAAACAPSVTIHNATTFGIIVGITGGDKGDAFSPSPGEESTFEFEGGTFNAWAMPNTAWKTQMTQTKQALNALLNDYTAHQVALTSDQIEQVLQKLRDIDVELRSFGDTPDNSKVSCTGSVSGGNGEGGGGGAATVTVSQAADGTLGISCS